MKLKLPWRNIVLGINNWCLLCRWRFQMGKYKSGAVRQRSFVGYPGWLQWKSLQCDGPVDYGEQADEFIQRSSASVNVLLFGQWQREDYIDLKVSTKWLSVRFKVSTNLVEDESQIKHRGTHTNTQSCAVLSNSEAARNKNVWKGDQIIGQNIDLNIVTAQ